MNTTATPSDAARNGPMTMALSLGFVAFILVVVFSAMICQAIPSQPIPPADVQPDAETHPPPYCQRESPPPYSI